MAEKKPSVEFQEAFGGTSGCHVECACEKVWFNVNDESLMNSSELETLLRCSKEDPDNFREVTSPIEIIEINGKEFAAECCLTQQWNAEGFIWMHKEQIARYLNARSNRIVEDAHRDKENSEVDEESVRSASRLESEGKEDETRRPE